MRERERIGPNTQASEGIAAQLATDSTAAICDNFRKYFSRERGSRLSASAISSGKLRFPERGRGDHGRKSVWLMAAEVIGGCVHRVSCLRWARKQMNWLRHGGDGLLGCFG